MIGVVLAGGLSTRMGRDKATLPFKGAKLLDYMVALLHKTGCEEVYVSGEFEGYACIPDTQKQLGPLGGIATVLHQVADREKVLFVPVDMPCLSVDVLETLKPGSRHAACFENSPLPLMLKNTADVREKVEKQIVSKVFSIKKLLQQLDTFYVSIEKDGFLRNANTPEEWEKISA